MAEYIERKTVIEVIQDNCYHEDIVDEIKAIPAADIQPVKHGRWIDKNPQDKYDPRCICSVCGSVEFPLSRHKYCPNCGAKMDCET